MYRLALYMWQTFPLRRRLPLLVGVLQLREVLGDGYAGGDEGLRAACRYEEDDEGGRMIDALFCIVANYIGVAMCMSLIVAFFSLWLTVSSDGDFDIVSRVVNTLSFVVFVASSAATLAGIPMLFLLGALHWCVTAIYG